jgi:hypothetical protein
MLDSKDSVAVAVYWDFFSGRKKSDRKSQSMKPVVKIKAPKDAIQLIKKFDAFDVTRSVTDKSHNTICIGPPSFKKSVVLYPPGP